MSSAIALKNWRKRTKNKIVSGFGGKCGICGYDKCNGALEFHHLDPKLKDKSLSNWLANPKKWEDVIKELEKCIMVCVIAIKKYTII
jgi:hypothetical protein